MPRAIAARKRWKWYNIIVITMIEKTAKAASGFDSDILEWNIPEEGACLGKKCFAFPKLDPGEIRRIKKSAYAKSTSNRLAFGVE